MVEQGRWGGVMRSVIGMTVLAAALAACSGPFPIQMNAARKTAIHECNVKASVWKTVVAKHFSLQRIEPV